MMVWESGNAVGWDWGVGDADGAVWVLVGV